MWGDSMESQTPTRVRWKLQLRRRLPGQRLWIFWPRLWSVFATFQRKWCAILRRRPLSSNWRVISAQGLRSGLITADIAGPTKSSSADAVLARVSSPGNALGHSSGPTMCGTQGRVSGRCLMAASPQEAMAAARHRRAATFLSVGVRPSLHIQHTHTVTPLSDVVDDAVDAPGGRGKNGIVAEPVRRARPCSVRARARCTAGWQRGT